MKELIKLAAVLFITTLTAKAAEQDAASRNRALPDYAALHRLVNDKKAPLTWVITGDSITHGAMHTHGQRSYSEHWMERVKWEMRRLDDIVIDSGVSGETTAGLLKQFDWRVARFKPAVVSINLGVNDSSRMGLEGMPQYRRNLELLVDQTRRIKAVPILQVPSCLAVGKKPHGDQLAAFCSVVRDVAERKKVLLVDHEVHWNRYAADSAVRAGWLNDPIHPNGKGHAEMFKKMALDLGFFDASSPTCKLGDKTIK